MTLEEEEEMYSLDDDEDDATYLLSLFYVCWIVEQNHDFQL